jgi:hypothetical protein
MKKIVSIITVLLVTVASMLAQNVPMGMKYQAVARDARGIVLANSKITLRINLNSVAGGSVKTYYSELHDVVSNEMGLFTLTVGNGKAEGTIFADIPWSTNDIWMEIAIRDNNKAGFTVISNSRLLSVPYAFHAGTASALAGHNRKENGPGVPAAVWSLKGNSGSNPLVDKLGTTDYKDLIMVTNNLERLKITADGNINIANNLQIENDLYVKRSVFLNTVSGETVNNGPFTVAKASPSTLSGSVLLNSVSGATTNHGAFTVANGSVSNLTGNVFLNSQSGATINNGAFTVANARESNLTGNLTVGRNVLVNGTFEVEVLGRESRLRFSNLGRLYLKSLVTGGSHVGTNYAMEIEGEDQGIMVHLNHAVPGANNHFLSFAGNSGIVGRIEGQTLDELHNSFEWAWNQGAEIAEAAFVAAEGVATASQNDAAEVVVMAVEGVAAIVKWIQYRISMEANVGVSFASANGDYAEWLEKMDTHEKFSFGDIVSVAGGKISKRTEAATKLMVISMSPIVLGNMPAAAREKDFEKVAFMGQVPVKVKGLANVGDFILASGKNDGTGIAVHPSKMILGDYKKIVGVAWSASHLREGVAYVNLAVGINNNDLVHQLEKQQTEVNELRGQLAAVMTYLKAKDPSFKLQIPTAEPAFATKQDNVIPEVTNSFSELEYVNRLINEKPELLEKARSIVKAKFENQGLDLNKYPALQKLFSDQEYFYSELRKIMK